MAFAPRYIRLFRLIRLGYRLGYMEGNRRGRLLQASPYTARFCYPGVTPNNPSFDLNSGAIFNIGPFRARQVGSNR
jgi:hypothetical protein